MVHVAGLAPTLGEGDRLACEVGEALVVGETV